MGGWGVGGHQEARESDQAGSCLLALTKTGALLAVEGLKLGGEGGDVVGILGMFKDLVDGGQEVVQGAPPGVGLGLSGWLTGAPRG